MADGIAHDLNNVLTAILGYTRLLQSELSGNEQAMADLEEIRKAAERAASLTRQLHAVSLRRVAPPGKRRSGPVVVH